MAEERSLIRNPSALPQSNNAGESLHQMLKMLIEEKIYGSNNNTSEKNPDDAIRRKNIESLCILPRIDR